MSGPRRDYASWGGSRNSEGRHENSGSRGDQRSRNDSSKYSRHRGSENVDKPDMCKRKGYQEARRQDRDRRDRRNERLGLGSDEYYEKSKVDDTFQLSTVKEAKSDFTVTHSVKESDLETKISKHVPDKRYDMSGKRYETKYLPLEKCSRTVPVKSKSDTLKPMKAPFRDNLKKNEVKDGGDTSKKSTDPKTDANKKSTAAGENSCTDTKGVNKAPGLMNLLQQSTDKKAKSQEKEPSAKELKSKGMTASDLEKQWQKEEEERKKREDEEMKKQKEEENKRLEEEKRIQDEEARKKKEEEEAELLTQEEIKTLEDFIKLTKENNEQKLNLREINICAEENYPDDSYFSRLDSSLKKTTAFVKKIKNLTETQKDSLTKDFNGLNLTKYIGELANGIAEAKLKMSDIGCALHISSLAHRRYADFASAFLESWQKVLLTKKDEKVPNPSKLRVDLRFFADLVMGGVFSEKEGLSILANQLNLLIANDKEEHNNLSIIISFCKHCGDDYAGLVPRKHRLLSEKYSIIIPRSSILPEERKKGCSRLLKEYYGSLCTHLHGEHKELKSIERQNRKILQTKGELTQERKDKHEAALQVFQKLMQNTYTFADLLDEDVPQLPEEKMETEDEIMGIDIYSPDNEFVYDGENTLFEDEDTRQFYENVPDLKSIVPQILYKDSEQAAKSDKNNEQEAVAEEEELDVEELEKEMEKGQKEADTSLEEEPLAPPDIEDDDFDIAASMRQILDAFLTSLPTCVNRDLIDKAAIDFCMNLNTKANRKKLVKTLFTVQRTRYDLLPFYSRLIATLHPCMPEVASDLVTLLKGDFKWHVRKKDQINIESKLKTVRFIGELVKFNMFPKAEALHCIKMLLFDFSHHNIEMACSLLETCGRFLYRCPDSHHRTKIYLAVIMRKKTALHFDQRYCTLIENAYYYSNPPESKKEEVVQRPPMHEYIRKLLYKDLSKITTEKILRQLRKLNWDDNEICAYTTKCLWAIWNVRYNVIHCCANLLAGLAAYHENVAISVVDGVIEDVRYGLEINHPKYNQRRVSCVKYLGELYNYRLVESSVIFKTLYSFITFGITYDDYASPLDPPEHLFRVRLVCVLLDTCGQYFDRGSSKKKLDCFLVYFQNYYWFKRKNPVWTDVHPFPVEMEYSYHDTLEILRPKLPIAKSFEEASAAVEELEKEFRAKLAEILPRKSEDEFTEQLEETDGTLTTIKETEEIDDLSQSMAQVQLIGSDVMTPHSQSQDSEDGYRSTQRSGSQSQSQQRETDEGEEQTGGKDYDAESDSHTDIDTEDEEQINLMMAGPKVIECTEDDDFMTAFDKMLTDNIQNRMQESTKVPTLDIAVPMHIKSQKTKYFMPGEDDLVEEEETDTKSGVKFVLMTKRGNKQQFSNLSVPVSEKFATEYKERENAEKLEKERMKRVVLNIHERQEEEDYQEMMASMSRAVGSNVPRKEPKQRHYHHPKGAPDAELIFGSKKR